MSAKDLLEAARRQSAALRYVHHRPWPPPRAPWIMGQTWEDLLFAHWTVPRETLQELVGPALPIDTFDGEAWLGITPFRLNGLRARMLPPLPGVSAFCELNVRTYVKLEDKPGVFFFSLDASSALAVEAARRLYRLPYFRARMSAIRSGATIEYASRRTDGGTKAAEFKAAYAPAGSIFAARPGSLEHFLTERYCLYTHAAAGVWRAEIHHAPWPLRPAECTIDFNTMPPDGVALAETPRLLHFADRLDVLVWPLERVRGGQH